ncbi:MAG: helix-turn-helix transcriptional regulator [Lachnospiraceae bacterium]|nr:helix-turn-helix transcriptional regulator [Lachnospiraceae bacterium]
MDDWSKYKQEVREKYPSLKQDIDEAEEISAIVGAMIDGRHSLNISQRDLAKLCGIPQSSVARIESGRTVPNLSTLIKIFNQLNLKLVVTRDIKN